MLRFATLMLILGLAGAPALAEVGLSPGDRGAIRTTIESQLTAFQRDDGIAAFAYAAPVIKEKFRTPEGFMAMVRTGYAPVYRPREVEFRDLISSIRTASRFWRTTSCSSSPTGAG